MVPVKMTYHRITHRWQMTGTWVKQNYVRGEIARVMNIFFSDQREHKWPSLKHTPNKGLMLSGPKGIGKTMEFEILNKVLQFDPNSHRHIRIMSVLEIEEQYKKACENKRGASFISELVNEKELMIDDLGSEHVDYNDFGTIRNLIADILMLRYPLFVRGEVITHATTNLTHEYFPQIYDSRTVDRFKEMFVLSIMPDKMKSKRQHPLPPIPEKEIQNTEPTPRQKRIMYLDYFMNQITLDNDGPPFYDIRDIMWITLVENECINPDAILDFDLKSKITKIVDDQELKAKTSKTMMQFIEWSQTFSKEEEILKLMKHEIMKQYFQNNKPNFHLYTSNQLSLCQN